MVKIDVISYSKTDLVEEENVELSRCIELIGKNQSTWINIIGIDQKTAGLLESLFNIHALPLEDTMDPEQKPKIEDYEGTLFIVTRTIEWTEELRIRSLSMFLTKKYVITIHDSVIPQLEAVRMRIREKLPKILNEGSEYLCFSILDSLVDSYIPVVERMGDSLEKLEDEIVANPSKKAGEKVHDFRKNILYLKKELSPELEALNLLSRGEFPHFKKETRNYLRDVYDHMTRVLDSLDSYKESTTGIQNLYFSSMQLQLNEVMKLLTIMATIILPLTLIASIYGMNLPIPESAHWLSYPIVLALMLIITVLMLFYFRKKHWL
jgi:magnesium transporter